MPIKVAIVAGGRGERLYPLTQDLPKPMLKIANKPVLEHHIDLLKKYGIEEVYILSGYMGDIIEEYFGDGGHHGITIRHLRENVPLGTAGCIKMLEKKLNDDFLVIYGDVMFDIDLDAFFRFHMEKESMATLAVHPNDHPYDSDVVVTDDNSKIIGFLRKDLRPEYYPNQINAGIYILSPEVFRHINMNVALDFVKNIFPQMLSTGQVFGYKTAEYIKDVGTFDRLERVSKDFLNGKIQRLSKRRKRPAVFMDRDGTLIKDVDLLHRVEELEMLPSTISSIRRLNESDYLSLVVTNQPVVARNLCTIDGLRSIHDKFETLLGDGRVYVDDIYYCPHHPDKGYPEENPLFKTQCGCRKPNIGMITKAAEQHNIDLASSWMVGDSPRDVQTAVNAGLRSILIRSRRTEIDNNALIQADFACENLEDAVDIILDRNVIDGNVREAI